MRIGGCNPCCGTDTYKVKGFRMYGVTGHAPITYDATFKIVSSTYRQLPFDQDEIAGDAWRLFLKKTEVWTSNSGYTKTVVSEYSSTVYGTLTTTTTYAPDQATFDSDWSGSGGGIGATNYDEVLTWGEGANEVHTIARIGQPTNWSKVATFETLCTDDLVFDQMTEIIDAKSWDDVQEHEVWSATKIPCISSRFNSDPWRDEVNWQRINGVIPLYGSWASKHPFLASVDPSNVYVPYPVAGYGFKSIRREQNLRDFMVLKVKLGMVACLQQSAMDSTGCATTNVITNHDPITSDLIEAPQTNFDAVAAEDPTWDGSYWRYAATATTQLIRNAVIPFAGPDLNVDPGCSAGREHRYRETGAQLNVLESTLTTCEEGI